MEDVIAHMASVTAPIEAAKSYTEAVTAHIAAVTSCMHPFEPAATAYEKMASMFLFERVFAPSDL